MTLTNRLLTYFLSMLGLVLICFSLALYTLANIYWHRQAEVRLGSLLDTLRSAVEIARTGLEWEPSKRHLNLGFSPIGERSAWVVTAGVGEIVDQGGAEYLNDFLRDASPSMRFESPVSEIKNWRGTNWLAKQEWIEFQPLSTSPISPVAGRKGRKPLYLELGIAVGLDLTPIRTTLRQLAVTLAGLSAAVWLVALVAGRFICRQALRPISQMADAAAAIEIDRLEQRISPITTPDEVGQLNRSFNSLLERMQTAFERQRRFTGDASHQLRTPLAALLGNAEVALRRDRTIEEYKQTLEIIQSRGSHLAEIVESLLFLSRSDSESQLPGRKPIDLCQWLPDFVTQWKDHTRFGDLRLEIASTRPTTVVAQPVLLTELLSAAVDNALKFTSVGSAIDIRLESDHEWAQISIEDHGAGIPPEDLSRLGEPFFRSEAIRQRGIQGVGLGLSIAKRLATLFGGKLTMTSQIGVGSIVRVELPLNHLPS